jgi:hypothetical protein
MRLFGDVTWEPHTLRDTTPVMMYRTDGHSAASSQSSLSPLLFVSRQLLYRSRSWCKNVNPNLPCTTASPTRTLRSLALYTTLP